jgi:hypothetical protein
LFSIADKTGKNTPIADRTGKKMPIAATGRFYYFSPFCQILV